MFKTYPQLKENAMMDDIVDVIKTYMQVRVKAGREAWPEDFPLQYVIDYRSALPNVYDELPTTKEVADAMKAKSKDRSYRMPRRPDISFPVDSSADDGQ